MARVTDLVLLAREKFIYIQQLHQKAESKARRLGSGC